MRDNAAVLIYGEKCQKKTKEDSQGEGGSSLKSLEALPEERRSLGALH